jgi:hypothetical protein
MRRRRATPSWFVLRQAQDEDYEGYGDSEDLMVSLSNHEVRACSELPLLAGSPTII